MGLEKRSPKLRGENISKVIAILTELDCALDKRVDENLTEQLSSLYQYMMLRLSQANLENSKEPLDEVEQILIKIKEGFEGINENSKKKDKKVKKKDKKNQPANKDKMPSVHLAA